MGAALRLLDQSARAWQHDEPLALRLTGDAVSLIGPDAVLAILELQGLGTLPACGTADWERLVGLADEGQVAIGTVLLIGDRDYVCADRFASGSSTSRAAASAVRFPARRVARHGRALTQTFAGHHPGQSGLAVYTRGFGRDDDLDSDCQVRLAPRGSLLHFHRISAGTVSAGE